MFNDSIAITKVQVVENGAEHVMQTEPEVRIVSSTKRKVSKPTYLRDYVWRMILEDSTILRDDAAYRLLVPRRQE